jgi:diguanylate cyclase (GGDEF)-like protein
LLDEAVLQHVEQEHILSVILVDIDNFKEINDSLGHYVGDGLIIALADRLAEYIGNRGTVARLGGDEFAVLLPMLQTIDEAQAIGNELVNAFSTPLKVREHEILVGISAGVSISIGASVDASTLLKNADLALYRAKSDGRGVCRMFEPQMALRVIMRREMEYDLRQAIIRNQFAVHYQPLIELAGGTEIGFEALLRWNHPEKGMIQPADFIAIAEATGMIVPMGIWVLEQACLTAMTLKEHLSVAVNVSPAQFKSGMLVAAVTGALEKSGLAAGRLELEITESSLLEKSAETLQTLNGLKELGVSIVLDDFGKGYSGLGCLNSFQFDKIKIDRSFVMEIGIRKKSEELVRAAVNIGQNLGIKTLAEGIETKEQFEFLRNLGCQQGQGFLFSRAVPPNKISNRLKLEARMRVGK